MHNKDFEVYIMNVNSLINVHITGTCTRDKAMDALFQQDIRQNIINSRMCVYYK